VVWEIGLSVSQCVCLPVSVSVWRCGGCNHARMRFWDIAFIKYLKYDADALWDSSRKPFQFLYYIVACIVAVLGGLNLLDRSLTLPLVFHNTMLPVNISSCITEPSISSTLSFTNCRILVWFSCQNLRLTFAHSWLISFRTKFGFMAFFLTLLNVEVS